MERTREGDGSDWLVPAAGVVHFVAWGGLLAAAYMVVPRYKAIFADFGVEPPGGVLLLISLSDWVVNFWYLLVPALLIALAIDVAVLSSLRTFGRRLGWAITVLLVPLAGGLIAVFALCDVVVRLNQDLS